LLEVTLGLTRLAAEEVVIACVIQDGWRGRTRGKSLLIVALGFVALLLGIELAGPP
jgi:hypothetical protein